MKSQRGSWTKRLAAPEHLEQRAMLTAGSALLHAHATPELTALKVANSRTHAAVLQNIAYENMPGHTEVLDVYEPAGGAPVRGRPALIAIHGGGWYRGDKAQYGTRVATTFTQLGYVVVAVNYQLATPSAPSWPTAFNDVQAAVRWVRSNAATLGINPVQIAAIGESAGGNLAELLGVGGPNSLDSTLDQVEAIVSFYGPSDLTALVTQGALGRPAAEEYLGGTPGQVPASYLAASPIDHVTSTTAPTLLLHGTSDTIVPIAQSETMARELNAAGVLNEFITVPGAAHGFEFTAQGRALVSRVASFLQSVWEGS